MVIEHLVHVWDLDTGKLQHHVSFKRIYIKGLKWFNDSETLTIIFVENVEIHELT